VAAQLAVSQEGLSSMSERVSDGIAVIWNYIINPFTFEFPQILML
jgi:hypothetical protein